MKSQNTKKEILKSIGVVCGLGTVALGLLSFIGGASYYLIKGANIEKSNGILLTDTFKSLYEQGHFIIIATARSTD